MRSIAFHSLFYALILAVTLSCSQDKSRYKLPDKIEHPKVATSSAISPRAFVDSLNRGAMMNMFYLRDAIPEKPEHFVKITGMKDIPFGSLVQELKHINNDYPIYLMCLYGDDSRRVSESIAHQGYTSYYVDGGSYRLYVEKERNGWKILPRKVAIE